MAKKALVLYVWDNDRSEVVGLFRAVGPGGGAAGGDWPRMRFQGLYDTWGIGGAVERLGVRWSRGLPPLTFDISDIRAFAARLSDLYPPPRYAIRDWLAESLEDFFISRYQATSAELAAGAMGRLPDPFATSEPSADPIALGDYQRWSPTGVEISRRPLGLGLTFEGDFLLSHPSGHYAVLKKVAFDRELRSRGLDPAKRTDEEAYLSELEAKGYHIYYRDGGVPEPCVFTTTSQSDAKELFLRHAATDVGLIHFVIPAGEGELAQSLHRRYGVDIWRAVEENYFFKGRVPPRNKLVARWYVSHRQEYLRAFGTDRLCADMK